MANEPTSASTASPSLQAARVYAMAAICLVAGLAVGYVLRGSKSPVSPAQPGANAVPASVPQAQWPSSSSKPRSTPDRQLLRAARW
jgi:hypothetical protein